MLVAVQGMLSLESDAGCLAGAEMRRLRLRFRLVLFVSSSVAVDCALVTEQTCRPTECAVTPFVDCAGDNTRPAGPVTGPLRWTPSRRRDLESDHQD